MRPLRLCAAALGGLILAFPVAGTDAGERAYAELCASCHRWPARVMRPYLSLSRERRRQALDTFLQTHYADDEATRSALIAWLEANHAGR